MYAFFNKTDISLQQAEKELLQSVEKSYDLFLYIILILNDLRNYAEKIIDLRMNRQLSTKQDKNPNTKFINNKAIKLIGQNNKFLDKITQCGISWANEPELIKKIYNELVETELYQQYMETATGNFEEDKNFTNFVLNEILYNSTDLYTTLEDKSIYWNYEIDFTITYITELIDKIKEDNIGSFHIPNVYKKDDDQDFVKTLLRKSILNSKEYEEIISSQIVNWDYERILKTDKMILTLAIAEIIEFNTIPVKVSMNEYIEIAKQFGTEKSGAFINGVLEKIVHNLSENKKFEKIGRGLINE